MLLCPKNLWNSDPKVVRTIMVCSKFEIRQVLRRSTRRLYQWALYRGLDEVELWWDRQSHQHPLCSPKTNGSKKKMFLKNFRSLKKCRMYYWRCEKQISFWMVGISAINMIKMAGYMTSSWQAHGWVVLLSNQSKLLE